MRSPGKEMLQNFGLAVNRILSNVGDRYVWGGGHGRNIAQENFDCSGGVRKWINDVTGKDIGPVTAAQLAGGSVADRNQYQQISGGAAATKTGQAGYWAYTGGRGRGEGGNHCGFWFVANGELNVIHARGRKYGVVLIKGAAAEKYVDKYVIGQRGGKIFSLGTVSDIAFNNGISELRSRHYGNGNIEEVLTLGSFVSILLNLDLQVKEQREKDKKREQKMIEEERARNHPQKLVETLTKSKEGQDLT